MQLRLGSYLANLMIRNLKFQVGTHKMMLLKPTMMRKQGEGKKSQFKTIGYITFNKGFVEEFITQLDKAYDLNL